MKKNMLKRLAVAGITNSSDLTKCEILEKELNEAKGRFKLAKKDVKDANQKLSQALEEVFNKMENRKKDIKETHSNLVNDPESTSAFNFENIKSGYDEAMVALDLRKNKIKKKIEEYNVEGTEKWDSFKHKLNHDLEELGVALKGFVTKLK
jgi:phosphoenolpyruvate-protein kinase (PTS system EI component)